MPAFRPSQAIGLKSSKAFVPTLSLLKPRGQSPKYVHTLLPVYMLPGVGRGGDHHAKKLMDSVGADPAYQVGFFSSFLLNKPDVRVLVMRAQFTISLGPSLLHIVDCKTK